MFDLAIRRGWAESNPAAHIKPQHKSKSMSPWPEDDVWHFINNAPSHLARAVLWLYRPSLRVGDAVRLERSMIEDNVLMITPEKTDGIKPDPIYHPLHTDLVAELNARPAAPIKWILPNSMGRPWTASGLRASLRTELKRQGLKHRPTHGLRYAFHGHGASHGWTTDKGAAMTGQSPKIVEKYRVGSTKRELVKRAAEKLRGKD